MSSLVPVTQCQCSWHGETPCKDVAASSQKPSFVLTVEFASSYGEEDATTANDEGTWDTCLSTEKPDSPSMPTVYKTLWIGHL